METNDQSRVPYWMRLVAEIRPMLAHLPGVDAEYVEYLADRVGKRNGADIDEYRALQGIAHDARRIRAMDELVRQVDASGCRSAVEKLVRAAAGALLPSEPIPADLRGIHPDDIGPLECIRFRQVHGWDALLAQGGAS